MTVEHIYGVHCAVLIMYVMCDDRSEDLIMYVMCDDNSEDLIMYVMCNGDSSEDLYHFFTLGTSSSSHPQDTMACHLLFSSSFLARSQRCPACLVHSETPSISLRGRFFSCL